MAEEANEEVEIERKKERAERKAALDKMLPRPYRPFGKKYVVRSVRQTIQSKLFWLYVLSSLDLPPVVARRKATSEILEDIYNVQMIHAT